MIACKPNFLLKDPGVGQGDGGYVLFVGRLSAEKGIATLLGAWEMLGPGRRLKIAGDGPMGNAVSEAVKRCHNVEWLGWRSSAEIVELMQSAVAVVCPSEWYEAFGLVVIEAFATGTPVIASRIGGSSEIIEHGRTGILFAPGDKKELRAAVEWAFTHPLEVGQMRRHARVKYESRYTERQNYSMLADIYQSAVTTKQNDQLQQVPCVSCPKA